MNNSTRQLHTEAQLFMTFRDVPTLAKFEQYVRNHSDCAISLEAYREIRAIITPLAPPSNLMDTSQGMTPIDNLKDSCAAIEKSTRILWACASSTGNITPPLWEYLPDYQESLKYFKQLKDLELMALTKKHQLVWENSTFISLSLQKNNNPTPL